MSESFSCVTPQKGPYNDRTNLPICLLEFSSNSAREKIYKSSGENASFEDGGAKFRVSRSKTDRQRSRNWAMKAAANALEVSEDAIDWGKKAADNRKITKDGKTAFSQAKTDMRGNFQDGFTHLKLSN